MNTAARDRRAARHRRRDYSEVVDFPVEIVSRSGSVRRYGFEEAVRLYQRRLANAVLRGSGAVRAPRYRDDGGVDPAEAPVSSGERAADDGAPVAPVDGVDAAQALAEVEHCAARIDQLRRSYAHLYRDVFVWSEAPSEPAAPPSSMDDLAAGAAHPSLRAALRGELVAFLLRALRGLPEDLGGVGGVARGARGNASDPRVRLLRFDGDALETGRETWQITLGGDGGGAPIRLLLDVFAWPGASTVDGGARGGGAWAAQLPPELRGELWAVESAGGVRERPRPELTRAEAAFSRRLLLYRKPVGTLGDDDGDVEQLLAWHHAGDAAFLLTGAGREISRLRALGVRSDDDVDDDGKGAWDEVVAMVQQGSHASAWVRAKWLIASQPWHRDAWAMGAALALACGQPAEAEDLAFSGSRWVRGDPALLHVLGVARWRQGRTRAALDALDAALVAAPDFAVSRTLALALAVRSGRWARALRLLQAGSNPGVLAPSTPVIAGDHARLDGLRRAVAHSGALWTGLVVGVGGAMLSSAAPGIAGKLAVVSVLLVAAALTLVNLLRMGDALRAIAEEPPEVMLLRLGER